MRFKLGQVVAAAALCGISLSAMALPDASVQWVQQTGTTGAADTVEVWVRLTVSPTADGSLYLDGTTNSLNAAELAELADFAPGYGVFTGGSSTCSTTFWPQAPLAACFDPASPWKFDYNYNPDNSFFQQLGIVMAPGESRDFLLATFTPQNGPVAPGIYSFSNAMLTLNANGEDANGDPIYRSFTIGGTCMTYEDSCAFTREVVAVPEPASMTMLLAGLLGMGAIARRRQR